jgi:hypothetical protein
MLYFLAEKLVLLRIPVKFFLYYKLCHHRKENKDTFLFYKNMILLGSHKMFLTFSI